MYPDYFKRNFMILPVQMMSGSYSSKINLPASNGGKTIYRGS